jgi:hypothetical protein
MKATRIARGETPEILSSFDADQGTPGGFMRECPHDQSSDFVFACHVCD